VAGIVLLGRGMKYIAVLLIGGGIFLYLIRPVPQKGAQAGSSVEDFLKNPLDRTHEVLKQSKDRADDPALQ
jgi:hypothetical protein